MSLFIPHNPNFAKRVRGSFEREQVTVWIGTELTQFAPARRKIHLWHKPQPSRQHGHIHGGIIGTIADSTAGYAGCTPIPRDTSVLTMHGKPDQ